MTLIQAKVEQVNRISKQDLREAQRQTAKGRALPDDWAMWFPDCVFSKLQITGAFLCARDILKYAMVRVGDKDTTRYIEAAQCFALLFYLGNPSLDTIVTVKE